MLKRWLDDGVDITVELSTQGDVIARGDSKPMPFVAGGPNGVPQGATALVGEGAQYYNFTTNTDLNRFSISNASSVSFFYVGARWLIPCVPGSTLRFVAQVQTIDQKTKAYWDIRVHAVKDDGSIQRNLAVIGAYTVATWADCVLITPVIPADVHQLQLELTANPGTPQLQTWGLQYTNLSYTSVPSLAPPDYAWRDITCDVHGLTTRYGRERFTNRYDIGSATIALDNRQGLYAYSKPHPFGLRPGRLVRVKAVHAGITYPLFYGVLDSIADGYSLDGKALATFTCYDPQSLYSNKTTPALGVIQKSGARINWLLDVAGYLPRAIDVGQWMQQQIVSSGRTLRDEMGVGADSEGSSIFADRTGQIVYKDRTWLTTDPNLKAVTANLMSRPHNDGMITKVDGIPELPDAPIICTNEMVTGWSLDRLINYVELANTGGTAEVYEDRPSQRDYGIFTYQRLDFVNDEFDPFNQGDEHLKIRANEIMASYKEALVRVSSIGYRPAVDPASWPWTLGVFLNWLVRVWYANIINEWGYAIATHVQAIEHRITPNDWETVIQLDQPISYVNAPIVEDITDQWDRAVWDRSQWRKARFTQYATFNKSAFEPGS
jgi:hypothetical protein